MLAGRLPGRRILCAALVWVAVVAGPAAFAQEPVQAQPVNPAAAAAAQVIDRPAVLYVPPPGTCVPMADPTGMQITELLPQLNPTYYQASSHPEPSSLPRGTILRAPTPTFLYRNLCAVDFAFSDGSLTRVPTLSGATREEATRRLAEADLQIEVAEAPSEEPTGQVFKQRPDPEQEVARQSVVEVVIALPVLYEVPEVIGLQLKEAVQQLRVFRVRRNEVPSARPRGEVTDQDPRTPAQRPAGAEVRVDISDGSLVRVPGVEQQPLEEARVELGQAELRAVALERESELAPGMVAVQDPPADSEVPRGSAVQLVVSTGLPVPNVIGRSIDEARALLARFVVEPTSVARREPQGEVVDQDPKPPARLAAGAGVRVEVSDGSLVPVPPVEGDLIGAAQAELQGAGLGAAVEEREDDREPGIVVTQNPTADTEVARGSVVQLVVSSGIAVPDVVGKPIEEALADLSRFAVTQNGVSRAEPRGQVVDQDPKPLTRVAAGSPVIVYVSDGSPEVPPNGNGGGGDGGKTKPNGPATPPWVLILGALAAGGVLAGGLYRWIRRPPRKRPLESEPEPEPEPGPAPRVSARVDPGPVEVHMTDAGPAVPDVRLAARLEVGESRVRLEGEPP